MSYLSTVWTVATALVSGDQSDHRPVNRTSGNLRSGRDHRPSIDGDGGGGERRIDQVDDSLRKVMYLSCWSQG
ncbi:hypothetical protein QJS10_CPB21g00744 [Acorus calamus]|uniref:Secreted protein n=1 Tax=Acorus calamus TaxID=4465 RepID=A0AAV9C556_ACOCL|nr:hypothetical protein QJS10_CPB21g00744 [Acorus calamus]